MVFVSIIHEDASISSRGLSIQLDLLVPYSLGKVVRKKECNRSRVGHVFPLWFM